jgi:hypothetical protein
MAGSGGDKPRHYDDHPCDFRRGGESMSIEYKMLIGGESVDAANGNKMSVINPANGEVTGVVPECGAADVDKAVRLPGRLRRGGLPHPSRTGRRSC